MELILDTSTKEGLLAIVDGGKILWIKRMLFDPHFSNQFVATIQTGLKEVGVEPKKLERIVVGRGPGSYTGLRASASIGQALSFSLSVPFFGVCSLLGFAGEGIPAFDARLGGVYVLFKDTPVCLTLEEFEKQIPKGSTIVSPHLERIQERLDEKSKKWKWRKGELSPLELSNASKQIHGDTLPLHYLKRTYTTLKESLSGKN